MATHDELLRQLSSIAAQNKIKLEAEEARAKKYADLEDADYMQAREDAVNAEQNPYAMSAQGASMGSAFGPWGTLVGGILGGVYGNVKDYSSRKAHGESTGDALLGSFKDTAMPWQNKDLMKHPMNTFGRAMPAVGTLGRAYQQNQANNALHGTDGAGTFDSSAGLGTGGSRLGLSDENRLATDDNGLQTYLSATGEQQDPMNAKLYGGAGETGGSLGWHVDPVTGKVKYGA
jgi:hypothetical protein